MDSSNFRLLWLNEIERKEKTQMFIHLHHLSGIKQVDWFFVFFLKYFLGIEMKLLIQYGVQSDETSTEGWNKFNFVRVYLSMCLLIWKKEEQFVFCLIFVLSILYLQTQYNYLSKQFARLDNYFLNSRWESKPTFNDGKLQVHLVWTEIRFIKRIHLHLPRTMYCLHCLVSPNKIIPSQGVDDASP